MGNPPDYYRGCVGHHVYEAGGSGDRERESDNEQHRGGRRQERPWSTPERRPLHVLRPAHPVASRLDGRLDLRSRDTGIVLGVEAVNGEVDHCSTNARQRRNPPLHGRRATRAVHPLDPYNRPLYPIKSCRACRSLAHGRV